MSIKSISESIRDAMAEEMKADPRVVLWGLDVGPYGGAFGRSRNLFETFGPDRVIDMPISEAGYVGAAVGAAATGLRPVVETGSLFHLFAPKLKGLFQKPEQEVWDMKKCWVPLLPSAILECMELMNLQR